jgi:hypothetical protein
VHEKIARKKTRRAIRFPKCTRVGKIAGESDTPMPIYEFFCPSNRRIYSFFARSLRFADLSPRCPDNPKWMLEKMISGFAITGRAKEKTDAPGGDDFDESKMEAAMGEMEREFGHVAESENPDPRALAKMMRRMGELSGQKLPAQMDEVIARLEKGEDPDKLEAEYGDFFDAMDTAGDAEAGGDKSKVKARRARRVTRDPKLYDMSEFCG